MSQLTIIFVFVVSLVVALTKGPRWAYVLVFLPALVLLNQLPSIDLQHAPVFAQYAPMYAILIALPFRREPMRFKFGLLDGIVALLVVSAAVTGWTTEYLETGVNALRNELLRLAMPYFLGRVVFQDWQARRAAVFVLAALMAVVGLSALIECRMYPYFYLHLLQNAGMGNSIQPMAYGRFGLFRASGPVDHPIFFGNMCVVMLGMTAVLARTAGLRLSNPWVALTLVASLGCVVVSFSFTPYIAVVAGAVALATLMGVPFTRKLVFPAFLAVVVGVYAYTAYTAGTTAGQKGESQLEGSFYTRQKIIRQSWSKAVTAGPFGYGLRADFSDDPDFDLSSVDNSYLQFTMTRGWVYTGLWVSIGLVFAWRAGAAFGRVTDRSQVFPLAASTVTVLSLMLSMYTVFAGSMYAVMWMIMVGLGNTLIDVVNAAADGRATAATRAALAARTRVRPPVVPLPAAAGGGARPIGLAHRA